MTYGHPVEPGSHIGGAEPARLEEEGGAPHAAGPEGGTTRPGWAETLDVLGLAVRVELAEPMATRAAELLADHARTPEPPQRVLRLQIDSAGRWALHDGDELVRGAMSTSGALGMLAWMVNQVAITTPHHVVLHAGCVARHGGGVVLSAPMEAGKSTLVTALVRDGWDYLSDEIAAVSLTDGRLHPYPAPIALDPGSFPLFPALKPDTASSLGDAASWLLRCEAVRPGSRSASVEAACLVFPRFQPGATCTLTALSATQALRLLVDQAFNLRIARGPGFTALAGLVRRLPRYQLILDDLNEACQTLRCLALNWRA